MYQELLTLNYWLGPTLPDTWRTHDVKYLYIAAILLLVGIGLWLFKKATKDKLQKDLLKRWYQMLFMISIFALIWGALRYELIPYLSTRVLILAIYLWGVYWAFTIFKYMLTTYKHEQDQYLKDEIKNKYI